MAKATKPKALTKDECSILIYLECRAVDYGGRMNPVQMNAADGTIIERWAAEGFIKHGRIVSADHNEDGSLWVWLSPAAFVAAQTERRARAKRMWERDRFQTTDEKRGGTRPAYDCATG